MIKRLWNSVQKTAQTIWDSTDSLTKWIQVIAVCVAAWWTFTNYSVADKPSLEPNLRVDSEHRTYPGWEGDTCQAVYSITVKNEGKVSFDVDSIHFRAWTNQLPVAKPDEATFVDAERYTQGKQIIDQSVQKAYLVRHYAPGQQLHQTFTWIFRTQPAGLTNFIVDVNAHSGDKVQTGHGRSLTPNVCLAKVQPTTTQKSPSSVEDLGLM